MPCKCLVMVIHQPHLLNLNLIALSTKQGLEGIGSHSGIYIANSLFFLENTTVSSSKYRSGYDLVFSGRD